MGVYLGALVQALVKDLVLPIIGLALSGAGIGNLATLSFGIPPTTFDSQGKPPAHALRMGSPLTAPFGCLVGTGPSAGMALIFIMAGIFGAILSLGVYAIPAVRDVETVMPTTTPRSL